MPKISSTRSWWRAETRSPLDSLRQAVDLLHLIIEQDIEPDANHPDRVQIAHKVAPNRVLSAVDPDMRRMSPFKMPRLVTTNL